MKSLLALAHVMLLSGALSAHSEAQQLAASAPTQYIDVDGSRIGYRSTGSGTPVVLLTRFRGTLDTWDPLFLDQLGRTHRVVTVDYPGVGYSSGTFPHDLTQVAAFVDAFTNKIGLNRFAVLGWSWGGIAAQTLLLQYPAKVTHAILAGTAPPGPGQAPISPDWLARALKPTNDLDDEEVLFFEPGSEFSRRAARNSHERIYARPGVTAKIPATEAAFQRYFTLSDQFKADATERRTQLTKSDIPILILCGDNDPSVPATNWYPLVGRIPRAQIVVLPQSGHAPQHQYPHLTARYIDAFLQQEDLRR